MSRCQNWPRQRRERCEAIALRIVADYLRIAAHKAAFATVPASFM
jgi:hypothetical protein